jgi:hypothetical protein
MVRNAKRWCITAGRMAESGALVFDKPIKNSHLVNSPQAGTSLA